MFSDYFKESVTPRLRTAGLEVFQPTGQRELIYWADEVRHSFPIFQVENICIDSFVGLRRAEQWLFKNSDFVVCLSALNAYLRVHCDGNLSMERKRKHSYSQRGGSTPCRVFSLLWVAHLLIEALLLANPQPPFPPEGGDMVQVTQSEAV